MTKAVLAIDPFCGLGGWTEGLLAEGYMPVGTRAMSKCGENRILAQIINKTARAKVAKIPLPLSSWIARTYRPAQETAA